MNTKQLELALVIFGLSCCFIRAADDEAKLMQQNSDWHITSEAFTNPPYWLIPTNVPFRLGPLNNGKWVWTTNINSTWFGVESVDLKMDLVKEQQIHGQWMKQQRKKWLESLPPGTAHVREYLGRWNTNVAENWQGVWAEDTNTGWRVNLCPSKPSKTSVVDEGAAVKVGSIITNSGAGLLPSPDGKYAKLELLDASGRAVPTRRGAALNLYQMKYGDQKEDRLANQHPPSSWDATVERNYPDTISDLEYPRPNWDSSLFEKGGFFEFAGFVSNGPPCQIGFIKFDDIFDIKAEGDYTLIVQPVLYRMHYDGGTFQGYLDRVDLPSVTTKVHLVPNVK